jgi:hypothetical protein
MLRFRLRSLLIFVAILAIPCAWAGHSLRWIAERRKLLSDGVVVDMTDSWTHTDAPAGLWLFGERGWRLLMYLGQSSPSFDEVRRAFPEAAIYDLRKPIRQEIDAAGETP